MLKHAFNGSNYKFLNSLSTISKHDQVSKFQGHSKGRFGCTIKRHSPECLPPADRPPRPPRSRKPRKTSNSDRNGQVQRSERSLREERPHSTRAAVGDVDRDAGLPVSTALAHSVATAAFSRRKRGVSYRMLAAGKTFVYDRFSSAFGWARRRSDGRVFLRPSTVPGNDRVDKALFGKDDALFDDQRTESWIYRQAPNGKITSVSLR